MDNPSRPSPVPQKAIHGIQVARGRQCALSSAEIAARLSTTSALSFTAQSCITIGAILGKTCTYKQTCSEAFLIHHGPPLTHTALATPTTTQLDNHDWEAGDGVPPPHWRRVTEYLGPPRSKVRPAEQFRAKKEEGRCTEACSAFAAESDSLLYGQPSSSSSSCSSTSASGEGGTYACILTDTYSTPSSSFACVLPFPLTYAPSCKLCMPTIYMDI